MTGTDPERTLILVKPDGVRRGLVGQVISRFETAGFTLVAMRFGQLPRDTVEEFYGEHHGKPFYEPLVEMMSSDPVAAIILERAEAIARARQLVGATDPAQAAPGTIRADLGMDGRHNTVHASDSSASAGREIRLLFPDALA
jgi:nucleoside-diphosphate kinase